MRSLQWLLIYLVVSFVWWFGAAVSEFQGAIDGGVNRTRAFLSRLAGLDVLPDSWQQATGSFLVDLPPQIHVTAVSVDDMGLLKYWLVWAVSGIMLYVVIFAVAHAPPVS